MQVPQQVQQWHEQVFLGCWTPFFWLGAREEKRGEERLNSPPSSFLSLSLFLLLPKTRREERGDRQRRRKKRNSLQRRKMGTLWAFQTRKLIEKKNHLIFPSMGQEGSNFPFFSVAYSAQNRRYRCRLSLIFSPPPLHRLWPSGPKPKSAQKEMRGNGRPAPRGYDPLWASKPPPPLCASSCSFRVLSPSANLSFSSSLFSSST